MAVEVYLVVKQKRREVIPRIGPGEDIPARREYLIPGPGYVLVPETGPVIGPDPDRQRSREEIEELVREMYPNPPPPI